MVAKLFSLYILVVTALAVVQAGTSATQCLIHPIRCFVDAIRGTAPLALQHGSNPGGGSFGTSPGGGSQQITPGGGSQHTTPSGGSFGTSPNN
jgi:hypothetical protein